MSAFNPGDEIVFDMAVFNRGKVYTIKEVNPDGVVVSCEQDFRYPMTNAMFWGMQPRLAGEFD